MNERIASLRKKYLSYAHIRKIKIESLPKVSLFSSNLDQNISLNGSNSDDDNRHFFRVGS